MWSDIDTDKRTGRQHVRYVLKTAGINPMNICSGLLTQYS